MTQRALQLRRVYAYVHWVSVSCFTMAVFTLYFHVLAEMTDQLSAWIWLVATAFCSSFSVMATMVKWLILGPRLDRYVATHQTAE